jgi:hypothetical protein
MKKNIYIAVLLSVILTVHVKAQGHLRNINGSIMETSKYVDVEGSPYFLDSWAKSTIKMQNGNTYKDMDVKLDEVEHKLVFKSDNGLASYFTDPIVEFRLVYTKGGEQQSSYFRSGYNGDALNFYEVLTDGNVQFLKLNSKNIKENKGYGEGTAVKRIEDQSDYFLYKDDKLVHLKRDKKFVFGVLSKQAELEAYIKMNNLNLKNDTDFAKIIAYYNSI